jgi:hypothetical protein
VLKLGAALTHGKQRNSLLNFGQSDDAYKLRLAVRGPKPALDARIGTFASGGRWAFAGAANPD